MVVLRARALLGTSAVFLPGIVNTLKSASSFSEVETLFDRTPGGQLKSFISEGNWQRLMTALTSMGYGDGDFQGFLADANGLDTKVYLARAPVWVNFRCRAQVAFLLLALVDLGVLEPQASSSSKEPMGDSIRACHDERLPGADTGVHSEQVSPGQRGVGSVPKTTVRRRGSCTSNRMRSRSPPPATHQASVRISTTWCFGWRNIGNEDFLREFVKRKGFTPDIVIRCLDLCDPPAPWIRKHTGAHTKIICDIVYCEGFPELLGKVKKELTRGWEKSTGDPFEIVAWCHRGRHRSVAVAFILHYILTRHCQVLDTNHLSKDHWTSLKCTGGCRECGDTTAKQDALAFALARWEAL